MHVKYAIVIPANGCKLERDRRFANKKRILIRTARNKPKGLRLLAPTIHQRWTSRTTCCGEMYVLG